MYVIWISYVCIVIQNHTMTQEKNPTLKQPKSLGKFYKFWEMNVNPITMKDNDYIVERSKDYR